MQRENLTADISYLKQLSKPASHFPRLDDSYQLNFVKSEIASKFREFYLTIGEVFLWWEKYDWSVEEFEDYLKPHEYSFYQLMHKNEVIGGVLLQRNFEDDPQKGELSFFGLYPDWTSKKIGFPFLCTACDLAWQESIKEFYVNTCKLDHPGALKNYQKAGFTIYHVEPRIISLPNHFPSP